MGSIDSPSPRLARHLSLVTALPAYGRIPLNSALDRFSHQFLGTGFEETENLDGGPTGMLAESKKRLWTTARDHGPVFGPSAS